jgi:rRNA processing protein Krr1/Pno1
MNIESTVVLCPRSMVGRVIGRSGATLKGIQLFTGAVLFVDQDSEPPTASIFGPPDAVLVARSMILDIVLDQFKGFAMLRELVNTQISGSAIRTKEPRSFFTYKPGIGLIAIRPR